VRHADARDHRRVAKHGWHTDEMSKRNQKLTVVRPVWSWPLITDLNDRFAWLVSVNNAG
jgi:hypothetical protein